MNESERKNDLNPDLQAALQIVESVLARQHDNQSLAEVSGQLSNAMQSMVRLRNCVTIARRTDASTTVAISLDHINAIISVMAGIEYPLAGIHWPRIAQVRDSLNRLMAT